MAQLPPSNGSYQLITYQGQCTWFGFGSGPLTADKTLSVTVSVDMDASQFSASGSAGTAGIAYSLDGGNTFTSIAAITQPTTSTTYTATIPNGTELANVQVRIVANPLRAARDNYFSLNVDVGTMVIS